MLHLADIGQERPFGDHGEPGGDVVQGVERRGERRGTVERAIMRLTGLDLKMEQYAAGVDDLDGHCSKPAGAGHD